MTEQPPAYMTEAAPAAWFSFACALKAVRCAAPRRTHESQSQNDGGGACMRRSWRSRDDGGEYCNGFGARNGSSRGSTWSDTEMTFLVSRRCDDTHLAATSEGAIATSAAPDAPAACPVRSQMNANSAKKRAVRATATSSHVALVPGINAAKSYTKPPDPPLSRDARLRYFYREARRT
jgi:hypothetical protein